jgi:hypothetical protein
MGYMSSIKVDSGLSLLVLSTLQMLTMLMVRVWDVCLERLGNRDERNIWRSPAVQTNPIVQVRASCLKYYLCYQRLRLLLILMFRICIGFPTALTAPSERPPLCQELHSRNKAVPELRFILMISHFHSRAQLLTSLFYSWKADFSKSIVLSTRKNLTFQPAVVVIFKWMRQLKMKP